MTKANNPLARWNSAKQPVYGDMNSVRITGSPEELASWDEVLKLMEQYRVIQIVSAPTHTYPCRGSDRLRRAYYEIKLGIDLE